MTVLWEVARQQKWPYSTTGILLEVKFQWNIAR